MSETIEEIRAATADLSLSIDGNDVVVTADPDDATPAERPEISVRLPIHQECRTEGFDQRYWTEHLTYPECVESDQNFEFLVGETALAEAIREVGDTAIAHLIGVDDYLQVARRVAARTRPGRVSLESYPLTLDAASGHVVADLAASPPRRLSVDLTPRDEEEMDDTQIYTWPSTAAPEYLPGAEDDPAFELALRVMGAGE